MLQENIFFLFSAKNSIKRATKVKDLHYSWYLGNIFNFLLKQFQE